MRKTYIAFQTTTHKILTIYLAYLECSRFNFNHIHYLAMFKKFLQVAITLKQDISYLYLHILSSNNKTLLEFVLINRDTVALIDWNTYNIVTMFLLIVVIFWEPNEYSSRKKKTINVKK